MNTLLVLSVSLAWVAILAGMWLGWQLLRQNGRLLLRLEELEQWLNEPGGNAETDQSLVTSAPTDERDLADRFRKGSLARSKIKRDGLMAGTLAPDFRLPRLDGRSELSLSELRGKRVLLVFSSPHCGPCHTLAPQLEMFHRQHPEVELVMVSKDEPSENRAKVKEHRLTFTIVLQQHWEISRKYAMFATPIAYLIDESGIIAKNVAVGVDGVQALLAELAAKFEQNALALA